MAMRKGFVVLVTALIWVELFFYEGIREIILLGLQFRKKCLRLLEALAGPKHEPKTKNEKTIIHLSTIRPRFD